MSTTLQWPTGCDLEQGFVIGPESRVTVTNPALAEMYGFAAKYVFAALNEVALGTIIADRFPYRSARALVSACAIAFPLSSFNSRFLEVRSREFPYAVLSVSPLDSMHDIRSVHDSTKDAAPST
jgi:hypothetical protein